MNFQAWPLQAPATAYGRTTHERIASPPSIEDGSGNTAMIERELTVSNRLGLHARATAKLVQLLSGYQCNVTLLAKGREVNAKSIMGVMLLAAGQGTQIRLRVDGEDEDTVAEAVVALFDRRFDEDQ